MNKELLEQLIPVVEKTKESLFKVIEAFERECPLVIEEFLKWSAAYHIGYMIAGLLLFFLSIVSMYVLYKHYGEIDPFHMLSIAFAFIGGGLFCYHLYYYGMITIAPRVFLLKEIGKLLGQT